MICDFSVVSGGPQNTDLDLEKINLFFFFLPDIGLSGVKLKTFDTLKDARAKPKSEPGLKSQLN